MSISGMSGSCSTRRMALRATMLGGRAMEQTMSTNSPNETQPAERTRPKGSSRTSPQALFETHLDVRDLDRSLVFYREIVGLELAYRQDDRRVAFLWIGGRGRSMLGLWEGGTSPNRTSLHIAFAVELDAVLAATT